MGQQLHPWDVRTMRTFGSCVFGGPAVLLAALTNVRVTQGAPWVWHGDVGADHVVVSYAIGITMLYTACVACFVCFPDATVSRFAFVPMVAISPLSAALMISGGHISPASTIYIMFVAISGAYLFRPLAAAGVVFCACASASAVLHFAATRAHDPDQAINDVVSLIAVTGGLSYVIIRTRVVEARTADALARQALQHHLTGLDNRTSLASALAAFDEMEPELYPPASLLLIDIDHFKRYNDTYGHPAGDAVLLEVAAAVRDAAGPDDVPARLGGDEFALLLRDRDGASALAVAHTVRSVCTALGGNGHDWSVSVGVADLRATNADTPSARLYTAADAALYEAKKGGQNAVCEASVSA